MKRRNLTGWFSGAAVTVAVGSGNAEDFITNIESISGQDWDNEEIIPSELPEAAAADWAEIIALEAEAFFLVSKILQWYALDSQDSERVLVHSSACQHLPWDYWLQYSPSLQRWRHSYWQRQLIVMPLRMLVRLLLKRRWMLPWLLERLWPGLVESIERQPQLQRWLRLERYWNSRLDVVVAKQLVDNGSAFEQRKPESRTRSSLSFARR